MDVYKNDISRKRWQGISSNIVFCYFGRDGADIVNGNYIVILLGWMNFKIKSGGID